MKKQMGERAIHYNYVWFLWMVLDLTMVPLNDFLTLQWCKILNPFDIDALLLLLLLPPPLSRFSRVRLFVTPWTVTYQAPLSMGFPRQEDWSGLLHLEWKRGELRVRG